MKKAALYARESPSLRENELTIESQVQAIKNKITENGDELVKPFEDNGWAGDLLARPALDELRDWAKQEQFSIVYIYDRSRLARKYWLQELIIDELESIGIEVYFLLEPKVENDEDRVLQGMKGLFAEYERVKITERTRRGRLHRAKKGLIVGHEALYGYKYSRPNPDEDARWFEIYEPEAKVVRLIFKWLAYDGLTLRGLIKRLYEKKILPREGGPFWASSTLARLVRCEAYFGDFHYNKTISLIPKNPIKSVANGQYKRMKKTSRGYKPREDWIPIKIPAIINKTTFNLAQEQLKRNLSMAHRELKYQYLLRGLMKCECGNSFAGDGAYRGHLYYRCTNRLRKFPLKKTCNIGIINADKIETKVWAGVVKIYSNKEKLYDMAQKYFKSSIKNQYQTTNTESVEKELSQLKKEEARWMDAYAQSVINVSQLEQRLKVIKVREKELIGQLERAKEESAKQFVMPNRQTLYKIADLAAIQLKKLTPEKKEAFLHQIINEIIISKDRAIVRGLVSPIDSSLQEIDVSENKFSSSNRIRCNSDNSRSGYKWAKSPILHNRRPSRQSCRGIKGKGTRSHQKFRSGFSGKKNYHKPCPRRSS